MASSLPRTARLLAVAATVAGGLLSLALSAPMVLDQGEGNSTQATGTARTTPSSAPPTVARQATNVPPSQDQADRDHPATQPAAGSPSPMSEKPTGDQLCSSRTHPSLAAKISQDLADALSGLSDTVALAVSDVGTGVYCARNADTHLDAASTVKVTILAAVLRQAMDEGRSLTAEEDNNLEAVITQSDNASAQRLWNALGARRVKSFLRLAGMTDTVPGPGGLWGLTHITATDEMRLLDVFASNPSVLSAEAQAYGLNLMHNVVSEQSWGTPSGAPAGITVHVKNGWLQRSTHGWRVHSLGIFTGPGKDYRMAVLTQDNETMGYGVTTIERIAKVVHRDLNPAVGSSTAR